MCVCVCASTGEEEKEEEEEEEGEGEGSSDRRTIDPPADAAANPLSLSRLSKRL
jgi:hypothetical protein